MHPGGEGSGSRAARFPHRVAELVLSGGRRVTGGAPELNKTKHKPNTTMHEPQHDSMARRSLVGGV